MSSSGTSATPLTEAEVQAMSTAEVRVNLERCSRLVANPSLLQRLPDGGEGIRRRHALFTADLQRRESATAAVKGTTGPVATSVASDSTTLESAQASRQAANEAAALEEARVSSSSQVAREMGEKYRDTRVDVEATVRRMYDGAISEAEIQRILKSVPPNYFLTYSETCAMEKALAKEARKEELQKLAAQAARQALPPS